MESRNVRQLLQSAATGSFLLLSAAPVTAGHLFPEEPQRPHITAACLPNWGYNPTCWQRFPPVPPCDGASDCHPHFRNAVPEAQPSEQFYTPPAGLVLPDQNIYSPPSSVLPPSIGGSRYSPPVQPDLNSPGSELLQPSSPMPSTFGDSVPPAPLPPLPSPPAGLSQPPGQTRSTSDRLMLIPEGRIVAGSTATVAYPPASSRYGTRSQTQPVLVSGEPIHPSRDALHRAGSPIHFASAPNLTIPAHTVSHGHSPISSVPSNRYGRPRQ